MGLIPKAFQTGLKDMDISDRLVELARLYNREARKPG
jgi:hypothetical protein